MPFICKPECLGKCCRNVGHSDLPNTDGVCDHLADGKCSIYDTRPLICRVDEAFAAGLFPEHTIDSYYKANYAVCEDLNANH